MKQFNYFIVLLGCFYWFCCFDQVSFNDTVLLKTIFSVVELVSTQKYPIRSNWK